MYLLDTCILSELIKPRPDPHVLEWIRTHDENSFFVSVLSLGEIEKGISRLPDSPKKEKLRLWLDCELTGRFAGRILDITQTVMRAWGKRQGEAERKGRVFPVMDSLIAATAIVSDLTVVTRNTIDLQPIGARTLNPWEK